MLQAKRQGSLSAPSGGSQIGRCGECIADNRYALNRILELARLETGQYRRLLEYIGYDSYELDKPTALDVMEHVGREALVEAYQRHEPTRETRSLLFCVRALIDALDQGEPLKTYGLHFKMTHDDPRLYLIGHASLEKRGLPIGQANIYQMLAPEHRLYLPFSLPQRRRAIPVYNDPDYDWIGPC
jgi:hypothetical protein